MSELRILSLGAGVQSTTLLLMSEQGIIPKFDAAVFADTQEEPKAVYSHLEWLRRNTSIPILVGTAGKLGDDLVNGRNSTGGRFASIPTFTTSDGGATVGITRRQCSKEYKTEVIDKVVRRDILGLAPRKRVPRGVTVHQHIGMSFDEMGRASRVKAIFEKKAKWCAPVFDLIDKFMTRANCEGWLQPNVPHKTPRSACVFCPYHNDTEWDSIRQEPDEWNRAVEVDHTLRKPGAVVNRKLQAEMYLHRSCKPLELAECMGMCGV